MNKFIIGILMVALIVGFVTPGLAANKKAITEKVSSQKVVAPAASVQVTGSVAVPVAEAKPSSPWLVEVGYGGGGLNCNFGYKRGINDKLTYKGMLGLGIGNGYSIFIIDLARLSYNLGNYALAGGVTYAIYSAKIAGIPGIPTMTENNLLGFEIAAEKVVNNWPMRFAFNTALGLRISAGYNF